MHKYMLLLLGLALTGCVSTRMNTYKDPAFSGVVYNSVLVGSNFKSLEDMSYFEGRVCRNLSNYDVKCQRSFDVFPPTRQYTDKQILENFVEFGADALILIQLTVSYTTRYVPQSSTTTGSVSFDGSYSEKTNTSGGYNESTEVKNYKISVIDGKSGQTALVGESTPRGIAFTYAKNKLSLNSLADELVNQLFEKGLIKKGPTAEAEGPKI